MTTPDEFEQYKAKLLASIRRPPGLTHRDDIAWWEAPLPRRWHRCSAQTSGLGAQRCACGAISMDGGRYWMEKNSTRKSRRRRATTRRYEPSREDATTDAPTAKDAE